MTPDQPPSGPTSGPPAGPRLLPYGDSGVLVELADTETVLAWCDALRAADPPEVADIVPAARTVLVLAAERTPLSRLRDRLSALSSAPAPARRGSDGPDPEPAIEIPVRYDGPDLAEVAQLTGLEEDAVVTAHTGAPWRVAFGGFAPGFGYLTGGDPRLVVPRRAEPRTVVPAGAVGLAGSFSGIYPRESPGGWQLIGTTATRLWDPDREPPALLRPGAVVRFVEVDR